VGVTLLVAEASFRFFEEPLLRRGRASTYWPKPAGATAVETATAR